MLTTPDGREGWATLFLRAGFAVYGSFAASFAGPSVVLTHSMGAAFGPAESDAKLGGCRSRW